MKLKHFFLPHSETHKRAHLISVQAILVYIFLFIGLQFSLGIVAKYKPDVLGFSSNVAVADVINLTNAERQKNGLPPLSEDLRLNSAAAAKAQNMFAENYWAHYSPSGKDPWGFILGSGYKFTYAGENLARNFYNSSEAVNAWMASPTHRENILNGHYRNIGIAVAEGTLNGQPTVLIVQEFGSPVESLAQAPEISNQPLAISNQQPEQVVQTSPSPLESFRPEPVASSVPPVTLVAGQTTIPAPIIDPYQLTKNFGLAIVVLLLILIALDFYIIKRRAVIRLTSRNVPHLALLSVAASMILNLSPGSVL